MYSTQAHIPTHNRACIKAQRKDRGNKTKRPKAKNRKTGEGRDLAHVPLYHTRGGIKLRHVTGPTKGDFQQKYIRVFGLNGAAVFQGPPGMIYARHGPPIARAGLCLRR